jgi:hypothetical protein
VDGNGNPVALSWLMDHRGGYSLLMLDLNTGKAEQFATPWSKASPFASILSTQNRFYTHCGNWFMEFDPVQRKITFAKKATGDHAMSMTEDDEGVIWSATYPRGGVASYDPKSGAFRDYGYVYKQNWNQYPRSIAADDTGWIYLGIGKAASQIVMLDPKSGETTPVIPESQRGHGLAVVERDESGKVYGRYQGYWWELYRGQATPIMKPEKHRPKSYVAGSQRIFHKRAKTGDQLESLDLVNRRVVVRDKKGEARTITFNYATDGADIKGVEAAANGTISGGTSFPMRFFSYDPKSDQWVNRVAYRQWNTLAGTDGAFFIGGYPEGFLLEWNPYATWIPTKREKRESNPKFLAQASPTINRPHDLLVYPGGRYVVLAGTPGYGLTGGGLMFWDRKTKSTLVLEHTDLLQWQSTTALAPLPEGKLLGGTTIEAGTGGKTKASKAELYILDMNEKVIEWHDSLIKGINRYTDMITGPSGQVFGFAEKTRFFVFDPKKRVIVHEQDMSQTFGPTIGGQGPRVFVKDPYGRIFVLFKKGIGQLDPKTYAIKILAESPVSISAGGAWLDGRIYFGHGSHLYSWQVTTPSNKKDGIVVNSEEKR